MMQLSANAQRFRVALFSVRAQFVLKSFLIILALRSKFKACGRIF